MTPANKEPTTYVPDYRLGGSYDEASQIDAAGLEALCPSYLEITADEPRYTGAELLGRGATKEVFRTFDTRTKRWVAIARLRPDHGPETYDRFIHEAWINSSLNHPNIIGIHDLGVADDGRPFFTMDLKGNTTLADLVRAPTPPSLQELLDIMVKVCDAIAYAHSRHTLHLDLKPENIQAHAFGEVLVCDWELGKITGGEGDHAEPPADPGGLSLGEMVDSHSLTGEIKGTPGFMAPEQAVAGMRKDERTDVFALGCILHVILTGEPPVRGGTHEEQLARTREADFASPRRRFPHRLIPASLEAIFHKATAREPADRYQAVAALRADLANYLAGYATAAEQAGFVREAALFVRRNRFATASLLLAVIVVTGLSVLFVERINHQALLTQAAKVRAGKLEDLNLQQSTEFRQSAKETAQNIARCANAVKNLGIFTDPARAVDETSRMAAVALTLDRTNEAARLEMFETDCIRLDFHAALYWPRLSGSAPYAEYLGIVKTDPGFRFDRTMRPPPSLLASFIRTTVAANPAREALMERIVSYDAAVREGHGGYEEVVAALLGYVNPGWSAQGFRYAATEGALDLGADSDLRLIVPPVGGSGTSLLRFIPVRSLRLAVAGRVDLAHLNQLDLQVLDLRDSPQAVISKPTLLPVLRVIHVRAGQFPAGLLLREIQSSVPIQVSEEP
jgi:hypothetical protein